MPDRHDPLELIDLKELSKLWKVSRATIVSLIQHGELDSVQLGSRRVVPRVAAEDYMRRHSSRDGGAP
jgi:excisionase family DNA binding protein